VFGTGRGVLVFAEIELQFQVGTECTTVEPLVYTLLTYASLVKTSDLRKKFGPGY
jgi:hypothetical protein